MPCVSESLRTFSTSQRSLSIHHPDRTVDICMPILFYVLSEILGSCSLETDSDCDEIGVIVSLLLECQASCIAPSDHTFKCSPILSATATAPDADIVAEAISYWLSKFSPSNKPSLIFTDGPIPSTNAPLTCECVRVAFSALDNLVLKSRSLSALHFVTKHVCREAITDVPAQSTPPNFTQRMNTQRPYFCGLSFILLSVLITLLFPSDFKSTELESILTLDSPNIATICYLEEFIDSRFCDNILLGPNATSVVSIEGTWVPSVSFSVWCSVVFSIWCVVCRWRGVPTKALKSSSDPVVHCSFIDLHSTHFVPWLIVLNGKISMHAVSVEDKQIIHKIITLLSDKLWRILSTEKVGPNGIPLLAALLLTAINLYRCNKQMLEAFMPLENELSSRVLPWISSFCNSVASEQTFYESLLMELKGDLNKLQYCLQFLRLSPDPSPRLQPS